MTETYEFLWIGIRDAWKREEECGFILAWEAKGIGFGEITVSESKGRLRMGTETMSKAFVMAAFEALYERAEKHDG